MPTALWTRSPAKAQAVCQSWFGRSHACFRRTRVPGRPPHIRPDGAPPTCRRLAAEGRGAALVLADAMGGADVRVIERGGGLRFPLEARRGHLTRKPLGRCGPTIASGARSAGHRACISLADGISADAEHGTDRQHRAEQPDTGSADPLRYRAGYGRSRPVEAVGAGVPTTGLARDHQPFTSEWRVVSTHMRSVSFAKRCGAIVSTV